MQPQTYLEHMQRHKAKPMVQKYSHQSPKHERQRQITIEYLEKQNQTLLSEVLHSQERQKKYRQQIKKLQRSKSDIIRGMPCKTVRAQQKPFIKTNLKSFISIKDCQTSSNPSSHIKYTQKHLQLPTSLEKPSSFKHSQEYQETIHTTSSYLYNQTPFCRSLFKESSMMIQEDGKCLSDKIQRLNDKLLRLIQQPTGRMNGQQKMKHRLKMRGCVIQLKSLKHCSHCMKMF